MEITDLSGEMSLNAQATGSLEGSYSVSMSVNGNELGDTSPAHDCFTPPSVGGDLGASIREQVRSNLAGALANLPSLPGIG